MIEALWLMSFVVVLLLAMGQLRHPAFTMLGGLAMVFLGFMAYNELADGTLTFIIALFGGLVMFGGAFQSAD